MYNTRRNLPFTDIFFRLEGCEDRNETHYLAHRLTKFVERNYNKNLSASEIEDAFSLGIDHLNRILKKAVGTSILKYRNALRIEAAKKKITESTVPFSEIAAENGFENYPVDTELKETWLDDIVDYQIYANGSTDNSWTKFTVKDWRAYEGDKALYCSNRWRFTRLELTGLNKNAVTEWYEYDGSKWERKTPTNPPAAKPLP